jgi:protein-S-isoprenylcysteine O-methyltransferase Ste14
MDMSNHPARVARPARPKSSVSHGVTIVGLIGMFGWMAVARYYGMDGPYAAITNVLACALPMLAWSLCVDKVHRNPSTGIDWSAPKPLKDTLDISLAKLAGLWATWGIIGSAYCLGRWYWMDPYLFSMHLLEAAAPWLFGLSIPYVLWLDRYLIAPRDGAWHVGTCLMGQPDWDRTEIANHARAWTVKGFFIAFMISIVPGGYSDVIRTPIAVVISNPVALAGWLINLMFVIDVAIATVGYFLTMRPLDAHIRSANPHFAGWVAALICYPPFIMMGEGRPLHYHTNTAEWSYWLDGNTPLLWIMGSVLVVLTGVYAWATAAFGIRFSNLSHRGTLTHGPYALTKHPAYMSKVSFWWLSTLPFLATTHSIVDIVRNTVMLGLVSGVYYWRARTEEQHLMADPDYQAYAAWMAEHSLMARAQKRLLRGARRLSDPVSHNL